MKRVALVFFSVFMIHQSLSAQQEVVARATELIAARQYTAANNYLDSVLKKNKNHVDALMMKGNVMLNHTLDTAQPMQFISDQDESVFSEQLNTKPKTLSKKSVAEIEMYWRKCLKLDTSRTDIRKGLCTVYAMALMKDSLKHEMARLIKSEKDDGEQVYRLAEYARKFKERNRFEEAMELYHFLAQQFPDVAGIRCDIASEYFYQGRMNEALVWLDSCYNFKEVDETTFLNGAFIYSELGYYDDAQSVLNTYSRIYERKMDAFYYGLRLFAESSDKYYETLESFCTAIDTNAYSNEFELAKKLMSFKTSFSREQYKELAADNNIPDYYKVLIHARGMKQFEDFCDPYFNYGTHQAFVRNHAAAVQFLVDMEGCDLCEETLDFGALYYSYSLLSLNALEKTLQQFELLHNSKTNFVSQAAKYFSAKIFLELNNRAAADKLFREIIAAQEKTKYGDLAATLLK